MAAQSGLAGRAGCAIAGDRPVTSDRWRGIEVRDNRLASRILAIHLLCRDLFRFRRRNVNNSRRLSVVRADTERN